MSAPTENLALRGAFDALERSIGAPLEELVAQPTVTSMLIIALRAQGAARRLLDAGMTSLLHFWNVPTRADVARLARQVAALDHVLHQAIDAPAVRGELPTGAAGSRPAAGEP